jgi:hypothetical protein
MNLDFLILGTRVGIKRKEERKFGGFLGKVDERALSPGSPDYTFWREVEDDNHEWSCTQKTSQLFTNTEKSESLFGG